MERTELEELFNSETFTSQIANATDLREIVKILAENGIVISEDELAKVISEAKQETELDEAALDNVAGGLIKGPIYWLGYFIGWLVARGQCK